MSYFCIFEAENGVLPTKKWFHQIEVVYFRFHKGVVNLFLSKSRVETEKNQNFRKKFFERSRGGIWSMFLVGKLHTSLQTNV